MKHFETDRKEYMKLAKTRLQHSVLPSQKSEEIYIVNAKRLTEEEILYYRGIVEEITASESFVENPLERMLDHTAFDKMNEEGKMRYLLEISKLFIHIKENLQN